MTDREKLIELLHKGVRCPGTVDGLGCSDCPHHSDDDPCDEYGATADMLIAHGVTVSEWISVKDRLPEEGGEYLAYCGEYAGICVLYYEVLKTKGKWRTKWKKVSHWMPLPQPPEEDKRC